MGVDSKFILEAGTTYAKAIPNFVAFGPSFPGEEPTAHRADEHLSLSKIILATEIYAEFIQTVITNDISYKL
jgi:acetylornithine deacetylase/succinyl-diaminopimelate desuccinylase-like protein